MPIRETDTFFNLRVIPKDGSKPTDYIYKSLQEAQEIEQAAAEQNAEVEVTRGQAFTLTTADTFDDILNVVEDPKIALQLFNYGLKIYQQIARGRRMKDKKWHGSDGDWDLIQDVLDMKSDQKRHKRQKDDLAKHRLQFRRLYAKRHPEAARPTDAQIDRLLEQMLENQLTEDAQSVIKIAEPPPDDPNRRLTWQEYDNLSDSEKRRAVREHKAPEVNA